MLLEELLLLLLEDLELLLEELLPERPLEEVPVELLLLLVLQCLIKLLEFQREKGS